MGIGRIISVGLLLLGGCTHMLAEQVVRAPNLGGLSEAGKDESPDELRKIYIDQQLRIPVGPPSASISVWICEPTRAKEVFKLFGAGRRVAIKLWRWPTTKPATAPSAPRGTIFVLHGIQDDKSLGPYVLFREMLVHQGYRVVQVDLRGHGRSTGDWITFGVLESRDLVQVLDALENRNLIAGKVGVVGISYGGAIAIQWAAIDPRVKAVVAIEPFSTLRDIAHDGAKFVLGPARFLFSDEDLQKALDDAGKMAGFNPDDANPLRAITQTSTPVLLIHSRDDQFIPYKQSQRLHDAAPDHSKLVLVDGASHFDIWLKSFQVLQDESLAWFQSYIAPPATSQNDRPTVKIKNSL
jgi:pimeloyl-ACP methyl ester carboxylesterase